jgi:ABC-type multidrug transport system fused ATPase/permease subunit
MGYFIGGMIFLVLGSLMFMVFPGAAGEMANVANGTPKQNFDFTVSDYGWIFLIVVVGQGVFSYFRTVLFAVVSERGMADLRNDLYAKIITQRVSFFEERRVGELTSRITADVEQLQNAFSVTLAEFVRQIITLVVGISILVYLTPTLSLIMFLTLPVVVIIAMIFGRYIRQLSKKRQDQLAETNTIVEETFQSFTVVKSFANEWYESARYARSVDEIVKISLNFAKVKGLFFVFILTVLFGAIFFILWRGALMVQDPNVDMEVGDLFSFILYTTFIGGAIASFGSLFTSLASAIGATERVQSILDSEGEINIDDYINEPEINLNVDIEYRDVEFSYPTRKDMQVLKGINLHIKAGEKVALVGQSGSGKSTIVQLLMKFYDLDKGEIVVGGKSLKEYPLTAYRRGIGVVPQEVILFGGTIKENILYGNPKATDEQILEASKQSNSQEFIERFPEGLETVVGERGVKLSGGQRQRIAIARAILKDPKVLLLDEATSSLDAESERVVQEALDRLMEGRTSIIIAHRLSTIRDVDCIYVLDEGKIVEKGTHDELYTKENGAYQQLAKLQFDNKLI